MNGVTNDLPLAVSITDDRRVSMTGTMNLKDWDALGALTSLSKVCFDLHKGPDGVSKTWEDVAIEISTFLRKKLTIKQNVVNLKVDKSRKRTMSLHTLATLTGVFFWSLDFIPIIK